MFIIFFNLVHIINLGGVNMDSRNATGVPQSDETFGFVPPDFMYGLNKLQNDTFSCKEEKERINYNLDHEYDNNHLQ